MGIEHKMVWEIERDREDLYDKHCVHNTNGGSQSKQNAIVTSEYAKLVCKQLRGTKWAMRAGNSCWIYKEGDTLAMGWVGHGDWQTATHGVDKFVVYGPFHGNGKYSYGSEQSHMSMFDDRDKAISKAKSVLRGYTVAEAAQALNGDNSSKVCGVQGEASDAVRQAGKDLGLDISYNPKDHAMLPEFKNMLATGYNFLDHEVSQNVQRFVDLFKVHKKRDVKNIPMYYIEMTKNRWGEEQVGIAFLPNARSMHSVKVEYNEIIQPEDVKDWMKQRVAALHMMPIGSYVEGVGYKICPTAYYIHTEEDNPFDDT